MTIRKCSTCKHYEPAPIWRKGWCRNPLLYSPQQSHLVGEDDLDCDRGMGNYWEPIELHASTQEDTGTYGFVASATPATADEPAESVAAESTTTQMTAQYGDDEHPERRGGTVSQYGGPDRPTGPGGSGGSGGGDDDRNTSPFGEPGGRDPYGSERQPFGYQEEERYWTDYLRIAAPVLGVIILLALVWFWIANLLDDNNGDEDVASNNDDQSGPVIVDETPTPDIATEEEDANGEDDGNEDGPISVETPTPEPETDENGNDGEEAPTTIGPGATVVVVGTGEEGLNIRDAASTDGEVVDTIANGAAMTVTGESQQADGFTWWPVDTGEVTGFAADDFVELAEEQ